MFGLSTFGIEHPAADAEIIRVVADVVAEVGLTGFRITYNNLNIFRSLITSAISDRPAGQNIDDILYDLRFAGDTEALISKLTTSHHLPSKVIDAILSLMECRGDEAAAYELLVRFSGIFPTIIPELEKTLAFQEALRNQGLTNTMLNVSNLHGTGFYSGLTYQTSLENRSPEIGDGGRYDQMMLQMHSETMSATGLGLGIERFVELLEGSQNSYKFPQPTQSILVAFEQPSLAVSCRKVLRQLRLADRFVEEDLVNRSFDKTVRYAKSKKCNRVVLVKSTETEGAVQLRIINLDSDTSVTLSAADQQELLNILLGC
jgi:histidyl-tRNA synthetase